MARPLALIALALLATGCRREERELRLDPPVAAALQDIRLMPSGISGAPPEVYFALGQPFDANAYALAQGKRLYAWFGCPACHGEGGEGGRGPAFLDGWWIYGPELVSVAASIRDGRPGGMPPFRDRMTIEQIWQLSGYVRAIGAYSASGAAPGRNDDPQLRPAENRAPAALLFDPGPRDPDAAR